MQLIPEISRTRAKKNYLKRLLCEPRNKFIFGSTQQCIRRKKHGKAINILTLIITFHNDRTIFFTT